MSGNGSGYQVNADELTGHAAEVDRVADTLGQALSAAAQVTMGVQAYGLICGPLFVPMVLAVSTPGLVTLGMAKEAMTSVATAVTETVRSYQNVEQSHAKLLAGMEKELG